MTTDPTLEVGHCEVMSQLGLTGVGRIPCISSLFKSTNNVCNHCANIDKALKECAKHQGIEIDDGIFFNKDTIKDIVYV